MAKEDKDKMIFPEDGTKTTEMIPGLVAAGGGAWDRQPPHEEGGPGPAKLTHGRGR